MQITVDTKKDSDDDIRKAIRFLQSLIGEHSSGDYGSENENSSSEFNASPDASSGMANMFGDTPSTYSRNKKKKYIDDDDDEKPEVISNSDDEIQVIPY